MEQKELRARRRIAKLTKELLMFDKIKLPSAEWMSIAKGALIAGAGAALTYLTQNISGADFGTYTPVIVATLSVIVNLFRKVITNETV